MAVDLDGTLVDRRGHVHPVDREAIAALSKKGIVTTILTGRLFSGTRAVAAEIGVVGPVGCVDGCHLVDAGTGVDLLHGGIAGPDAERLRTLLGRHEATRFVFANDRILYDPRGEGAVRFMQTWSREHSLTRDVLEHEFWTTPRGVTAVVVLASENTIRALAAEVEAELSSLVQMASFPLGSSALWGAVLRSSGHSKGTALERVARHHGLQPSNVIAIGDWYNDLPMFRVAGRSFAMAQAPDDVKRAATDSLQADERSGGGIAEAAMRAGLL